MSFRNVVNIGLLDGAVRIEGGSQRLFLRHCSLHCKTEDVIITVHMYSHRPINLCASRCHGFSLPMV